MSSPSPSTTERRLVELWYGDSPTRVVVSSSAELPSSSELLYPVASLTSFVGLLDAIDGLVGVAARGLSRVAGNSHQLSESRTVNGDAISKGRVGTSSISVGVPTVP